MAPSRSHPLILLGMGNVHRALLGILESRKALLEERYGLRLPLFACSDRSGFIRGPDDSGMSSQAMLAAKSRGISLREIPGAEPVSLAEALDRAGPDAILLDAASMDLEGGAGLEAATLALEGGQSVVFANKSAVALAFDELEELARTKGAGMGWSATVCGGLPVVNIGRRETVAARFLRVAGVFNSTSNLVLDRMADGKTLEEAVAEAKERGIAETDPTNDLNGTDTALKLVIVARTILGFPATLEDVDRTGVEAAPQAIPGHAIRLLGEAEPEGEGFRLRVAPKLVSRSSFLGGIGPLDMAIEWETDLFEIQRFASTEADAGATAAAVLRDAVHIALGIPAGPSVTSPSR